MALITPEQIRAHLPGYTVTDAQAASAVRLVSGWLLDVPGLDVLPDIDEASTDPDPLWSDAMELAVLVVTNPELLAAKTVGPTSRQWNRAVADREAILDRVRSRYRPGGKANASGEFGCFPDAEAWPDPPMVWPGWVPR